MRVGTLQTYWSAPSTSQSPAVRLIKVKLYVDPLVREAEMLPLVTNSPRNQPQRYYFLGNRLTPASALVIKNSRFD